MSLYARSLGSGIIAAAGGSSGAMAISQLIGDVTAVGPGIATATLATVNPNVGSFGLANSVSTFTVNGKGLITAASNTLIQIATSQVTNLSGINTGDVTLAPFDAAPNANGASLSGQILTLQPASASFPGGVSTTTQTLAGSKTFTSDVIVNTASINNISLAQAIGNTSYTTGLINGGIISVNTSTTVNITAGTIAYLDYSVSALNPTMKLISFGPFNAVAIANIAADVTYFLVDNTGALFQQVTYPTPQDRRLKAYIALASTPSHSAIQGVNNSPDFAVDVNSQLYDFFDSLGAFNISGNTIAPNGANLNVNRSAGTVFKRSSNYINTNQNPHVSTLSAASAFSFMYATQTAIVNATVSVLDPSHFDVGGTVTLNGGTNATATIQRVFSTATGVMFIQYGQTVYASLAAATAAVGTETFITNPSLALNTILLGFIILVKNTTQLNNAAQATFIQAGKFGNAISSSGNSSLQTAYNNSTSPEIVLTSVMGALQITDNATPLGTSLFNIADSTGVTKYLDVDVTGITSSGKIVANRFVPGFTTQAAANSTLTMTTTSTQRQVFTGSVAGQIVKLPTTSIVAGAQFDILNDATVSITVQSSAANTILVMPAGSRTTFIALVATPTTAANWDFTQSSLQAAYNSSTVSPEIVLTSTGGALQIADNATPLGASLFTVSDNGLSTKYLDVDSTGITSTGKGAFSGQLSGKGTATNNNAATGFIGEYLTASAGPVSPVTTNTGVNLTSVTLTAGDWDVWGATDWAGGTVAGNTYALMSISASSGATTPFDSTAFSLSSITTTGLNGVAGARFTVGPVRVSIAGSTTIFLNAQVNFTTLGSGNFTSESTIRARRVR